MTKLALALLPFAIACTESAADHHVPAKPATIHAELATATPAPAPDMLSLTGKIVADQRAEITADVPGRVVATLVERGQRVKRGQPVIQLDVDGAALSTREASAKVQVARTDQGLAAIECDRSQQLFAVGAISRSELDRQAAQCASTSQNVHAAEAHAAILAKSVKDGVVRAPFDGIVSERAIAVGEWVAPGRALFTLVDADPLKVELSVPEANIAAIAEGQDIAISTVARPGVVYHATVTRLAAEIGRTRSLIVEATVKPGSALVPGMFVEAELVTGHTTLPAVPETAVAKRGKSWHLFVVDQGRIEERIVQLGASPGPGRVSIVQNLTAGEQVVASVTDQITDGLVVE